MQDPKLKTTLTVKKTDIAGTPLAGATFQLWQESNQAVGLQTYDVTGPVDPTKDTYLGDCVTVLPDGTCTLPEGSDAFEITWPNTYYWAETVPPAGYSLPASADRVKTVVVTQANISDPFPPTVFTDPKPDIVTSATATDLPDGTITDFATLSGVPADATGTLHFTLYGPFDDGTLKGDSCIDASKIVTSQNVSVSGPGRYPSGTGVVTGTATKTGTYYWYVTFTSPDDLFGGAVEPCGSPNEVVTVHKGAPGATTHATQNATYLDAQNGTIQDTVLVRPVTQDATRNLTVSVYGPFQSSTPNCSASQAGTWTATRAAAADATHYTTTLVSGSYEIDFTTPALAGAGSRLLLLEGDLRRRRQQRRRHAPLRRDQRDAVRAVARRQGPGHAVDLGDPELAHHAGRHRPGQRPDLRQVRRSAADRDRDGQPVRPAVRWCAELRDQSVGARRVGARPHRRRPLVSNQTGTYVALSTPNFTPTSAGTYRWAASYSGDNNYLTEAAACPTRSRSRRSPSRNWTSSPTRPRWRRRTTERRPWSCETRSSTTP